MFEVYLWIVCFISLYVALFWINIIPLKNEPLKKKLTGSPLVTITIAAYNEAEGIIKTIQSLLNLDYPKNKLQIIVVNDGSKDRTKGLVEEFIKDKPNVELINHEKNKGKGAALNTGLSKTKGKYFVVFDADSIADPQSLKMMLPYFSSPDIAAVISAIKVLDPKTTVEKIQRLEYIFTTFIRKLMSKIGTLHNTPGVLSIYVTKVLKEIGGFDEHTLTEDHEVAMRLKFNKYNIAISTECANYTVVPATFKALWRQRIRWFRGFIESAYKYRKMILNKDFGLMGTFQTPLNLLGLFLVFASLIFFSYHIYLYLLRFIYRISLFSLDELKYIQIPGLTELLLAINLKILFPVTVSLIAGVYIYFKAHSYINEQWKFHFASFVYLFIYPLFRSLQWLHAFVLEATRSRRKW